jgi:peptidoglycan/xylan/chitin deacetylase (PgdA/CDA1 family)
MKTNEPEVPKAKTAAAATSLSDFTVITARYGDTFASLAKEYLGDPALDWMISEVNGIDSVKRGAILIIPLGPYNRGGLTMHGYQTVPVLSYHQFSLDKSNRMTVTAGSFEEQMKFLKENGYRVITMDQLFDFLQLRGQIPQKSVVITIDDGWRSAYEIAFPILRKYGFPATLFVYTDLISSSNSKTLSWDLIKEMQSGGFDIQCHSKTHVNMTELGANESFRNYTERINSELDESSKIFKNRLNKECKYFAYPYSDTNSIVVSLLKRKGFRGAFTVDRDANPFFIGDYRVNRSMIYGDFDINKFKKNLIFFSSEGLK